MDCSYNSIWSFKECFCEFGSRLMWKMSKCELFKRGLSRGCLRPFFCRAWRRPWFVFGEPHNRPQAKGHVHLGGTLQARNLAESENFFKFDFLFSCDISGLLNISENYLSQVVTILNSNDPAFDSSWDSHVLNYFVNIFQDRLWIFSRNPRNVRNGLDFSRF